MKIFCTGVSGYIGGSIAVALAGAGHTVNGLVRSKDGAEGIRALGIEPIFGTLDDAERLDKAARWADVIVNAASADHEGAVDALLNALVGSNKQFIHTSGSSIVGTRAAGQRTEDIFDETTQYDPSPARADRVALNKKILSYAIRGLRPVVICPGLVYGKGLGMKRDSIQIPLLIAAAKMRRCAVHIGSGANVWSNVHIADLVELYSLAINLAPAGAFYFAENGEASMAEVCQAINQGMAIAAPPISISVAEASAEWGEGVANDTMGSNSRVRAVRARKELGWNPRCQSLIGEILHGYYLNDS
jgi:nucleoside-diphosphate-sugar epimerase